jgi:hypothetical protein
MNARLLVCGSRTFNDYDMLSVVLDHYVDTVDVPAVVINGGADGADMLARRWARAAGIPLVTVHADWKAHGKAAGPIRNQQMLDEYSPDLVFAFYDKPRAESRGTAHMVGIARKAGVEVAEFGGDSSTRLTGWFE